MKISPVKGTRDFYPAEMAIRNYIIDGWKKISIRNGFEEIDSPVLEHLQMFTLKSGEEIVEQLFSLKDRGGRDLALIPEMTPSLARMVNQRINSLPKPLKWFSVPRLFRAERPQKGRLREFFQWNTDIIGTDSVIADVEIIFTTLDYLQFTGLAEKDITVKVSSRKLLSAFLKSIGISENDLEAMYVLLDKKPKLPADTFEALLDEKLSDKDKVSNILAFMETDSLSKIIETNKEITDAKNELLEHQRLLSEMGVGGFYKFDPSIVRGLAYYTGIVFEVHAIGGELRAICGGGRYDNLLKDFGGPDIPAVGMGFGDCVLEILLREKGLLDKKIKQPELDYFVACADRVYAVNSGFMLIVAKLRQKGFVTDFSYKVDNLSKQLKTASERNAKKCVIIGEEFVRNNNLLVKDMATGEQQTISMDKFLDSIK